MVALVAVVACIGGIESSEKSAEDTASPCHGELIVFSLFLLASLLASLNRSFESLVSGPRCLLLSLVSGCPFLASVNKLRKGKDAAAERLCSTVAQRVLCPPINNRRSAVEPVDGARGFASGHRLGCNGHAGATPCQSGHGIPCAVGGCAARSLRFLRRRPLVCYFLTSHISG